MQEQQHLNLFQSLPFAREFLHGFACLVLILEFSSHISISVNCTQLRQRFHFNDSPSKLTRSIRQKSRTRPLPTTRTLTHCCAVFSSVRVWFPKSDDIKWQNMKHMLCNSSLKVEVSYKNLNSRHDCYETRTKGSIII